MSIEEGVHKVIIRGRAGNYYFPISISRVGKTSLKLKFSYNEQVVADVKSLEGRRFNPDDKSWTISDSPRNEFTLRYMKGESMYTHWKKEVKPVTTRFPLMDHQKVMFYDGATYLHMIWAAEMGTGKTLACFALLEHLVCDKGWSGERWYVGTKASIRAVNLERIKWKPKVWFDQVITYDSLKKIMASWPAGKPAPRIIFLDESSRIKNPTTQRSQMSYAIAQSAHKEFDFFRHLSGGLQSCIVEMSGSPAPKEPTDWWHQCEIVCPGYLKEGNIFDFKKRLALVIQKDNVITGAAYPHLVTWWDDENKCKHCGKYFDFEKYGPKGEKIGRADEHDPQNFGILDNAHLYEKSVNEILKLHQRMNGLVRVIFKKDCMNLPEKIFREIELTPSKEITRAAKLIVRTAKTTMDAMIRLRELSDGFQYKDIPSGKMVDCFVCHGTKNMKEPRNAKGEIYDPQRESIERNEVITQFRLSKGLTQDTFDLLSAGSESPLVIAEKLSGLAPLLENLTERCVEYVDVPCTNCDATGKIPEMIRSAIEVPCPKDDALLEILEDHEDVGRCVTYAGFMGSIDRICNLVKRNGWEYLRFDGRGVVTSWDMPRGVEPISNSPWDCLAVFQKLQPGPENIVFVGHPMAAGMGLTLTASPSIVYFSNDYNAESKIQSQDRIHRPGMDLNRGATIYELLHLPSDRLVLDNLRKKQDLQALTLGVVKRRIEEFLPEEERR